MNTSHLVRSIGLLVSACSAPLFAQETTIWTGAATANAFWNNNANWTDGTTSATKAAVFDSTSTANLAGFALNGGVTTLGITVSGSGDDLSLAMGGHQLTVREGGITLDGERSLALVRNTTGNATFVSLATSQTWSIAEGRTLTLSTPGEYDILTNDVTVTMSGGGAVTINSINFDIGQANSNNVIVDGVTLSSSAGIRLGQGPAGVGRLTIKSGAVNSTNLVQFGSAGGASGHLVVEGGATLRTPLIRSVAGAGASSLTFDGATFVRTAHPSDPTIVNIIDLNGGTFTTSLGDGGLTIDTNDQDVGLQAPMGNKTDEVGTLTKVGAGALTISSVNTYTGRTTVDAGKLALDATGTLASTHYQIAPGAIFDVSAKTAYDLSAVDLTLGAGAGAGGLLDAGSAQLVLGGDLTIEVSTSTPDTSYPLVTLGGQTGDFANVNIGGEFGGSLSLTATDTWTGAFGGYDWSFNEASGVLTVTAEGGSSDFASWAQDNGLVGADAAADADPDGDGMPNLIEYALGADPVVSDAVAPSASGTLITFEKGAEAILNGDVSWSIETSQTLAPDSWVTRVTHAAGDTTPTISFDLSTDGGAKNFARLRVTR